MSAAVDAFNETAIYVRIVRTKSETVSVRYRVAGIDGRTFYVGSSARVAIDRARAAEDSYCDAIDKGKDG